MRIRLNQSNAPSPFVSQPTRNQPLNSPKNIFGENSLRHAVREYLAHYHQERNHQGLENKVIDPAEDVGPIAGEIKCRDRLGGMLRYYYRDAA